MPSVQGSAAYAMVGVSFIVFRSGQASTVIQPHRPAHVAHRFLRQLAGFLVTVGDDVTNELRVVEIGLGTLAHRCLLAQDAIDHRLLALQTTDTGAATTF